jgi:hypothetical protein
LVNQKELYKALSDDLDGTLTEIIHWAHRKRRQYSCH